MERKLELKDIAGYFPYGLRCKIGESFYDFDLKVADNWFGCYDKVNIFLRPLSDLYKTITHNGKEIIPIVELAKITFPLCEYWKLSDERTEAFSCNYGRFYFENGGFCIEDEERYVTNQYQLFNYLNELKIDYRGLIESGLAVSVYDLEDNPYK